MRQVVLVSKETGGFTASVPSLPGCTSHGATIEEAMINIRHAIMMHIASLEQRGARVPKDVEVYVLRVDVD
jgi:predicted RNase H-like HicB family nuclease